MTKAALLRAPSPPLDWKYAPSRESTDIVSLNKRYGLFIDGEFRAPLSRKYFPTINPRRKSRSPKWPRPGRKTSTVR